MVYDMLSVHVTLHSRVYWPHFSKRPDWTSRLPITFLCRYNWIEDAVCSPLCRPKLEGSGFINYSELGGIGGVLTGGAKVDFILAGFCGYLVGIFTSGRGRLGSQACQLDEELEVISIVPYSWPSSCMLEVEVGICPDISLPSPTLNLVIILGEVLSLMDPAFITIRARSV